jgi:hypothetical protein
MIVFVHRRPAQLVPRFRREAWMPWNKLEYAEQGLFPQM